MPRHILVASIGNPPPYAQTLHSAGHILSSALLSLLSYPPLSRSSSLPGLISSGSEYTFYQSPSLMNSSGKPVATAYKAFVRVLDSDERKAAKMVVLHDELEAPLGKIKLKVGGSARGHNGLKDIVQALGDSNFIRIGVGIGRPESRDSRDVANFVLRKMTMGEVARVTDAAGDALKMLEKIREG